MSKVVKEILSKDIARRLAGVEDCVVANMIGLDSEKTSQLRRTLREKKISVMVIKNSLARRATEGTPLAPAFAGLTGTAAVLYGSEDFVSLVKEVVGLDKDANYESFKARGGVMDGESLSPETVLAIAKWPNRAEQLSILSGQILSPGATLGGQLKGAGGKLASQIAKLSEEKED
ncbi:MAG: 50S ribosomal protein L10 [Pirellulaceae bacterium]|jgi:large subunit ribosomal protein L10|nr:50S ribosomal protein L10 [Pirellulaceae bacterium]